VSFRVPVVLGIILLVASYHKVLDPPDFTNVIYHYKLFPALSINLLVIYMPWVEVVLGLALFTGLGRRGASLLAMIVFFSFIVILSYNLYRGCPTVCGCFSTYEAGKDLSDADKFAQMYREIGIDMICLLLALHTFVASFIVQKRSVASSVEKLHTSKVVAGVKN
jgi:uncharacterized membrane protein YphA (DoxX/SURF4 family)